MSDTADQAKKLEYLHGSYKSRKVRLMLGAGVSMASGLPGWNELNRRLLQGFFLRTEAELMPETEELRAFADTFADRFGRESVVDLVRDRLGIASGVDPRAPTGSSSNPPPFLTPPPPSITESEKKFFKLLHDALYPESRRPELHSLQYEIAAFLEGDRNSVFTFNYDCLIEDAVKSLRGARGSCRSVYNQDSSNEYQSVVPEAHVTHLHGMLQSVQPGEEPEARGQIVFSEKDYFNAGSDWDWSKTAIKTLLSSDVDIVLVGLSLADPRLRNILRERLKPNTGAKARVWAIFTPVEPESGAPLERKRALRLLKRYESEFWSAWNIEVLRAENHEVIPFLLRCIRLGADGGDWWTRGKNFLFKAAKDDCKPDESLYSAPRQEKAFATLSGSVGYLRSRFAISKHEEIGLAFFVPAYDKDNFIRLAFHIREGYVRNELRRVDRHNDHSYLQPQHVTREWAGGRELSVSIDAPQGVTGRCFIEGVKYEATVSSPLLDLNFDSDQKKGWTRHRTFQWILSVPVMDSKDWVPVGVVCITSNQPMPFWRQLPTGDGLDLDHVLRALFREIVGYRSREELSAEGG